MWDITSYVKDMYNQGMNVDIDIRFVGHSCLGYGGFAPFASRENTNTSIRPYIMVFYSPSPSKPTTPTTGSISISSSPSSASIYLDGTYTGTAPNFLPDVPQGSHTVKLTLPNYNDWSYASYVTAGSTSYVTATLTPTSTPTSTPTTGTIAISSTPSGASIYLDSVYKGTTPKVLNDVSQGSHNVKLTLAGYNDWSDSPYTAAGGTSYLKAELITATPREDSIAISSTMGNTDLTSTGTIAISSTPSGASIYFDGVYEGTTPKLLNDVDQGSHDVKLTLSGYNDWSYETLTAAGRNSFLKAELITATPTLTPLPTPTSTQTPQPSSSEMLDQTNGVLVGGSILAILLVGALVLRKLKGNETKAAEKTTPFDVPAEEPDRKSKAVFIEKSKEPDVKQPKESGAINVKSAYEYKGAKIYFKIKVENNTIEPISDIKVHLFVPEVFLLSEKEKFLSMLEPKESKTVTFEIRPTGECGDCNVSGKVEYYDYSTKRRQMLDIETKSLSIICPVLKRKEIDVKQWEQVTDDLIKAEENIKELSVPAENLFNITSRVIKDSGMFMLKPEITSNPQLFNGIAMFYAEGVTGLRYAAYIEVVGGSRKSRMILKVWAEKEEALTGFYHRILDEIEKRIDVKIFIDDTIVQQHIHIGDKIGTQIKDSLVQRSNIGDGKKKCPECGREVEANEKFCNECGAKL